MHREKHGKETDRKISFDFRNMMATVVGDENGIAETMIDELSDEISRVDDNLKKKRERGNLPFFDLPYQDALVEELIDFVDRLKPRFENLVVLGIGGSALGAIALKTALTSPFYNLLSKPERKGNLRLFVADNIDPDEFNMLLRVLDPKETVCNVISKSGETAETMSQFLIMKEWFGRKLSKEEMRDHIIVTTDKESGNLRTIVEKEGYKDFVIPAGVGGRFSVFTPVGLLPGAAVGIDIGELLSGAAFMDTLCRKSSVWENPAYMNGTLHFLADVRKGKRISVMMPYAAALRDVADWYRQIWAESLGKKLSLNGETVYVGPTPVRALGVTDQHSQLQLYIEGPSDKVITFITVDQYCEKLPIPRLYPEIEGLDYLGGHTLNELIQAEQRATAVSLSKNRRLNCTINLPCVSAFSIGQLLFFLEVQTAFIGGLYRINPFDQPGVEEGKQYAYGIMGRKGFERKKEEADALPAERDRYII
ncbi:MAG: glucose-6-phosphate isomerase [Deltaproteobacteria bacterium]|nr:glucose-6-phosphate isomerase [Deltaproteobacteria bacterium]